MRLLPEYRGIKVKPYMRYIIDFFYKSGTWVNAINAYVERGILLNTPKGFYIRRMEGS